MAGPTRIDLEGALAGRHVLVNEGAVTMGFLEDIQTTRAAALLDAVSSVIVGGDLPHGTDRAGLRALTMTEFAALVQGVTSTTDVPKAG